MHRTMTTVNPLFVKLCIPSGLEEILEGLAREVLRRQPTNIRNFGAIYFDKLLSLRREAEDAGAQVSLKTLIAKGKFLDIKEEDLIQFQKSFEDNEPSEPDEDNGNKFTLRKVPEPGKKKGTVNLQDDIAAQQLPIQENDEKLDTNSEARLVDTAAALQSTEAEITLNSKLLEDVGDRNDRVPENKGITENGELERVLLNEDSLENQRNYSAIEENSDKVESLANEEIDGSNVGNDKFNSAVTVLSQDGTKLNISDADNLENLSANQISTSESLNVNDDAIQNIGTETIADQEDMKFAVAALHSDKAESILLDENLVNDFVTNEDSTFEDLAMSEISDLDKFQTDQITNETNDSEDMIPLEVSMDETLLKAKEGIPLTVSEVGNDVMIKTSKYGADTMSKENEDKVMENLASSNTEVLQTAKTKEDIIVKENEVIPVENLEYNDILKLKTIETNENIILQNNEKKSLENSEANDVTFLQTLETGADEILETKKAIPLDILEAEDISQTEPLMDNESKSMETLEVDEATILLQTLEASEDLMLKTDKNIAVEILAEPATTTTNKDMPSESNKKVHLETSRDDVAVLQTLIVSGDKILKDVVSGDMLVAENVSEPETLDVNENKSLKSSRVDTTTVLEIDEDTISKSNDITPVELLESDNTSEPETIKCDNNMLLETTANQSLSTVGGDPAAVSYTLDTSKDIALKEKEIIPEKSLEAEDILEPEIIKINNNTVLEAIENKSSEALGCGDTTVLHTLESSEDKILPVAILEAEGTLESGASKTVDNTTLEIVQNKSLEASEANDVGVLQTLDVLQAEIIPEPEAIQTIGDAPFNANETESLITLEVVDAAVPKISEPSEDSLLEINDKPVEILVAEDILESGTMNTIEDINETLETSGASVLKTLETNKDIILAANETIPLEILKAGNVSEPEKVGAYEDTAFEEDKTKSLETSGVDNAAVMYTLKTNGDVALKVNEIIPVEIIEAEDALESGTIKTKEDLALEETEDRSLETSGADVVAALKSLETNGDVTLKANEIIPVEILEAADTLESGTIKTGEDLALEENENNPLNIPGGVNVTVPPTLQTSKDMTLKGTVVPVEILKAEDTLTLESDENKSLGASGPNDFVMLQTFLKGEDIDLLETLKHSQNAPLKENEDNPVASTVTDGSGENVILEEMSHLQMEANKDKPVAHLVTEPNTVSETMKTSENDEPVEKLSTDDIELPKTLGIDKDVMAESNEENLIAAKDTDSLKLNTSSENLINIANAGDTTMYDSLGNYGAVILKTNEDKVIESSNIEDIELPKTLEASANEKIGSGDEVLETLGTSMNILLKENEIIYEENTDAKKDEMLEAFKTDEKITLESNGISLLENSENVKAAMPEALEIAEVMNLEINEFNPEENLETIDASVANTLETSDDLLLKEKEAISEENIDAKQSEMLAVLKTDGEIALKSNDSNELENSKTVDIAVPRLLEISEDINLKITEANQMENLQTVDGVLLETLKATEDFSKSNEDEHTEKSKIDNVAVLEVTENIEDILVKENKAVPMENSVTNSLENILLENTTVGEVLNVRSGNVTDEVPEKLQYKSDTILESISFPEQSNFNESESLKNLELTNDLKLELLKENAKDNAVIGSGKASNEVDLIEMDANKMQQEKLEDNPKGIMEELDKTEGATPKTFEVNNNFASQNVENDKIQTTESMLIIADEVLKGDSSKTINNTPLGSTNVDMASKLENLETKTDKRLPDLKSTKDVDEDFKLENDLMQNSLETNIDTLLTDKDTHPPSIIATETTKDNETIGSLETTTKSEQSTTITHEEPDNNKFNSESIEFTAADQLKDETEILFAINGNTSIEKEVNHDNLSPAQPELTLEINKDDSVNEHGIGTVQLESDSTNISLENNIEQYGPIELDNETLLGSQPNTKFEMQDSLTNLNSIDNSSENLIPLSPMTIPDAIEATQDLQDLKDTFESSESTEFDSTEFSIPLETMYNEKFDFNELKPVNASADNAIDKLELATENMSTEILQIQKSKLDVIKENIVNDCESESYMPNVDEGVKESKELELKETINDAPEDIERQQKSTINENLDIELPITKTVAKRNIETSILSNIFPNNANSSTQEATVFQEKSKDLSGTNDIICISENIVPVREHMLEEAINNIGDKIMETDSEIQKVKTPAMSNNSLEKVEEWQSNESPSAPAEESVVEFASRAIVQPNTDTAEYIHTSVEPYSIAIPEAADESGTSLEKNYESNKQESTLNELPILSAGEKITNDTIIDNLASLTERNDENGVEISDLIGYDIDLLNGVASDKQLSDVSPRKQNVDSKDDVEHKFETAALKSNNEEFQKIVVSDSQLNEITPIDGCITSNISSAEIIPDKNSIMAVDDQPINNSLNKEISETIAPEDELNQIKQEASKKTELVLDGQKIVEISMDDKLDLNGIALYDNNSKMEKSTAIYENASNIILESELNKDRTAIDDCCIIGTNENNIGMNSSNDGIVQEIQPNEIERNPKDKRVAAEPITLLENINCNGKDMALELSSNTILENTDETEKTNITISNVKNSEDGLPFENTDNLALTSDVLLQNQVDQIMIGEKQNETQLCDNETLNDMPSISVPTTSTHNAGTNFDFTEDNNDDVAFKTKSSTDINCNTNDTVDRQLSDFTVPGIEVSLHVNSDEPAKEDSDITIPHSDIIEVSNDDGDKLTEREKKVQISLVQEGNKEILLTSTESVKEDKTDPETNLVDIKTDANISEIFPTPNSNSVAVVADNDTNTDVPPMNTDDKDQSRSTENSDELEITENSEYNVIPTKDEVLEPIGSKTSSLEESNIENSKLLDLKVDSKQDILENLKTIDLETRNENEVFPDKITVQKSSENLNENNKNEVGNEVQQMAVPSAKFEYNSEEDVTEDTECSLESSTMGEEENEFGESSEGDINSPKIKPESSGTFPCGIAGCRACPHIANVSKFSTPCGEVTPEGYFTCNTKGVVYGMFCKKCPAMYVGRTKRTIRNSFTDHIQEMERGNPRLFVDAHFTQDGHTPHDAQIVGLFQVENPTDLKENKARIVRTVRTKNSWWEFGLNQNEG